MLSVFAEPADAAAAADVFDLGRLQTMATVLRQPGGGEHLMLGDGRRHLRITVARGTVFDGPVRFHYELAGFATIEPGLTTLRRLCRLQRLGRLPRHQRPRDLHVDRWLTMLRAYDAWRDGASHREIAGALFGESTVREDWGGRSDYLRLRVQRLLRGAKRLVAGGYRKLLR